MIEDIIRTEYDLLFGDRYRQAPKGDSSPLVQKWIDFETQRKEARRKSKADPAKRETRKQAAVQNDVAAPTEPASEPAAFNERDEALIKAFNDYYGPSLPSGKRHPTFTEETSHWMCWVCDNDPEKATRMSHRLDWVTDWHPNPGEVEDLIQTASKKKLLTRCPKALKELLQKAGIDSDPASGKAGSAEEELPFDEWIERIRQLFDVYPCVREICEPHPERLWPFLFFAAAAMLGTDMTLCWFHFYDMPEQKRRLNYNVLGIGDPACGKGALTRLENLLTEPIEQADQIANDAVNAWKEEQRSKSANKDKSQKPKGIVRKHGARTSNNVFINDMVNAWAEVQGERMQEHMLTVDTEALNSIKMQKGGSWIDKQVLEIKAWSNEKDNQQYANLDSVSGFFHVFWNLIRTCTPPALKMLANERNFGTGWPTRVSAIPVLGTGFKMIPLRKQNPKALDADETLRQWAYRQDKRRGELPIWPLVEHSWHWTNDHMEIAEFNDDKADELLLKRISMTSLCIAAPYVDMRHNEEREKTDSYVTDDQDLALLDLVIDIQYRTQQYWFGELARNYFDEQMKDATQFRRRTTRFEQCFQQLPEEFTTEQFTQVFGYANPRSAAKTIDRFLKDKVIERTKRGEYRKRVKSIS